jgi:uncharacterized membrane protein SirB2
MNDAPRSLSRADGFNRWLRAIPTVNAKMFVAYGLAVFTVATLCVCFLIGAWRGTKLDIDEGVLAVVCAFITALAGVGHLDYKAQRNTWKQDPPPDDSPGDEGEDSAPKRAPEVG